MLLEEADNVPAGPPTIYPGGTDPPEGAALTGLGREPVGWDGAGGALRSPALGGGGGGGDSKLRE